MTIDRSARRNACTLVAWRDLAASFVALGRERQVRLVILTGAAGHLSAGADPASPPPSAPIMISGAVDQR